MPVLPLISILSAEKHDKAKFGFIGLNPYINLLVQSVMVLTQIHWFKA